MGPKNQVCIGQVGGWVSKKCSSNWIIFHRVRGEHKKHWKSPPSKVNIAPFIGVLLGYQKFHVPKMEGILYLIRRFWVWSFSLLHEPYPYSLYMYIYYVMYTYIGEYLHVSTKKRFGDLFLAKWFTRYSMIFVSSFGCSTLCSNGKIKVHAWF